MTIDVPGEVLTNPCEAADAPPECEAVPSGPACGDGSINQDSEACDDGNSLPGDGCSGVCVLEAYHECRVPGEPCISTIVCGDGVIGPGEACDDANQMAGDGCAATCNLVERGYACRTAGEACIRVYVCGDGSVDPNEGCDDGNLDDADGCSVRCRLELGFKCSGSPSSCTPTDCSDRVVEGAESCDDGNQVPFDGCSEVCRAEPTCGSSGSCSSSCGDGIVLDEACDDGNLRSGDGCSSTCSVEEGFVCDNVVPCELRPNADGVDTCTMNVTAVFRDFNAKNSSGGHPDFQPGTNSDGEQGLVDDTLDGDRKPTFTGQDGGNIQSQTTFGQWYRSVAGVNATRVGNIVLWQNAAGSFVNRWGPNGEQWVSYNNPAVQGPRWCAAGNACGTAACAPGVNQICVYPCPYNNNNTDSCIATPTYVDGSPAFFPVDPPWPGVLNDTRSTASIPQPEYFGNWAVEPGAPLHNFHFTTEVKYWFRYDPAAAATLAFTGDDDVWVFVNRRLALDLGGWHPPLSDTVTINATAAASFGLSAGNVYEIAVFQAERQTSSSSFRLTLSGFTLAPSDCHTNCGDGQIGLGEECDDGPANDGAYDHCSPSCTLGPRCGDAIRQDQYDEACDDGVNDGAYGGCAPDCRLGPHCGDGVVTDQEQCDDAVNDGGYGECYSGCVQGSFCGDGQITLGFEECDDGNNVAKDGCSPACKREIAVTE